MALPIGSTSVPREVQPAGGGTALAGVATGLVAGACMMLFAMAAHWALDNGVWTPPLEIACVVYGPPALLGGASTVVVGLLIHAFVSVFWGTLFTALMPRGTSSWTALWAGVVYGMAVWAVMTFGVLPWANETMRARVDVLADWFFYEHIVFGAALLGTPLFRDRMAVTAANSIYRPRRARRRIVS